MSEDYEQCVAESGEKCHCIDCCEHPSCATTGICVAHCEECNGECVEVKQ